MEKIYLNSNLISDFSIDGHYYDADGVHMHFQPIPKKGMKIFDISNDIAAALAVPVGYKKISENFGDGFSKFIFESKAGEKPKYITKYVENIGSNFYLLEAENLFSDDSTKKFIHEAVFADELAACMPAIEFVNIFGYVVEVKLSGHKKVVVTVGNNSNIPDVIRTSRKIYKVPQGVCPFQYLSKWQAAALEIALAAWSLKGDEKSADIQEAFGLNCWIFESANGKKIVDLKNFEYWMRNHFYKPE